MRRLTLSYWAWINAKIALAGWGLTLILVPPPSYAEVVTSLYFVGGALVGGSVISMIGMWLSLDRDVKKAITGLIIELFGVALIFGGAFQFLMIQLGYLVQGEFDQRSALTWLAWSTVSFTLVRASILAPSLRKYIKQNRQHEAMIAERDRAQAGASNDS